jgi:hypothetical protein
LGRFVGDLYHFICKSNGEHGVTNDVGETTNNVYNLTIYKLLTPNSIASWLRAMTANRLATNGKHWTELFSRYNSGALDSS